MDMSLSKLPEIVKDREAWHAAVHGIPKCQTWLSNWTTFLLRIPLERSLVLTFQSILSSVQFSCLAVSDSLRPHGLQHTRLRYPSPTPGACSNSCPLSQWCNPTILSSVVLFSSCLQSFPASWSFLMNQFFATGGQNIGSFSFSISPSNEYSGLISNILSNTFLIYCILFYLPL